MSDERKTVVISGINLFSGGTLRIYKDLLEEMDAQKCFDRYRVVLFVHKEEDFAAYKEKAEIIALPKSRKSYLYRLHYEYHYFKRWSKMRDVHIWFSVHDFTPSVKAEHRYVYCHNPLPFFPRKTIGTFFFLYSKFYMHFYKKNITKNDAVITQQVWMKEAFLRRTKAKGVWAARPTPNKVGEAVPFGKNSEGKYVFFFPSLARRFKNFEAICEAFSKIEDANVEARITISGEENDYAASIKERYGHLSNVRFLGLQNKDEMAKQYEEASCLIFPSKAETWGLPITEFEATGKPIIASDLPYAHETVGDYGQAAFFNPDKPEELRELILRAVKGENVFTSHVNSKKPDFASWQELVAKIF